MAKNVEYFIFCGCNLLTGKYNVAVIAECSKSFFLFLPGEFTLRAFLNGRLDLSQAENVEKLISAKSVAAADAALAGIQVVFVFQLL